MRVLEPPTQTVEIAEVRDQLDTLISSVRQRETRVVVEESGIPVAAIVSAKDLERLGRLEHQRAEQFKIIDEIREAFKDVPAEESERETDRIVARIRAEDVPPAQGTSGDT